MTSGHAAINEVLGDFEGVFTARKDDIGRCGLTETKSDESTDRRRQTPFKSGGKCAHLPIVLTRKDRVDLRGFADRHHRPPDVVFVTASPEKPDAVLWYGPRQ
jgi:hypothetical protein